MKVIPGYCKYMKADEYETVEDGHPEWYPYFDCQHPLTNDRKCPPCIGWHDAYEEYDCPLLDTPAPEAE